MSKIMVEYYNKSFLKFTCVYLSILKWALNIFILNCDQICFVILTSNFNFQSHSKSKSSPNLFCSKFNFVIMKKQNVQNLLEYFFSPQKIPSLYLYSNKLLKVCLCQHFFLFILNCCSIEMRIQSSMTVGKYT